jgi:chromosome segregation ATPase
MSDTPTPDEMIVAVAEAAATCFKVTNDPATCVDFEAQKKAKAVYLAAAKTLQDALAERDTLRAARDECERQYQEKVGQVAKEMNRAERAEAELATERNLCAERTRLWSDAKAQARHLEAELAEARAKIAELMNALSAANDCMSKANRVLGGFSEALAKEQPR